MHTTGTGAGVSSTTSTAQVGVLVAATDAGSAGLAGTPVVHVVVGTHAGSAGPVQVPHACRPARGSGATSLRIWLLMPNPVGSSVSSIETASLVCWVSARSTTAASGAPTETTEARLNSTIASGAPSSGAASG